MRHLRVLAAAGMVLVLAVGISSSGALATHGGLVERVYIATGENFPDALGAGSPAALGGGPVLLVRQNSIPAATLDELNRLQPHSIAIVGGTGVVSTAVENQLKALSWSPDVDRIGGADRYETAGKLSAATFPAAQPAAGVFKLDWSTTSNLTTELDRFTVSVPGPGALWVEVAGNVWIDADATTTSSILAPVWIGLCDTAASSMSCDNTFDIFGYQDPDNATNGNALPGFSIARVIPVASAGDVTLYVNGRSFNSVPFSDSKTWASVIYLPDTLAISP